MPLLIVLVIRTFWARWHWKILDVGRKYLVFFVRLASTLTMWSSTLVQSMARMNLLSIFQMKPRSIRDNTMSWGCKPVFSEMSWTLICNIESSFIKIWCLGYKFLIGKTANRSVRVSGIKYILCFISSTGQLSNSMKTLHLCISNKVELNGARYKFDNSKNFFPIT